MSRRPDSVIPARAEIFAGFDIGEIPACAGMTEGAGIN